VSFAETPDSAARSCVQAALQAPGLLDSVYEHCLAGGASVYWIEQEAAAHRSSEAA
jgi:hypothetical protein